MEEQQRHGGQLERESMGRTQGFMSIRMRDATQRWGRILLIEWSANSTLSCNGSCFSYFRMSDALTALEHDETHQVPNPSAGGLDQFDVSDALTGALPYRSRLLRALG